MKNCDRQSTKLKNKIKEFRSVLTGSIGDSNQVFLVSHNNPDFDAIASLGAAALICKRLKKAHFIVIDDNYDDLSEEILEMIDKLNEKFMIITLDDYEKNKTDNDLLITVDVNKNAMTSFDGKYKQFKNIVLIDHHLEDKNTIKAKSKFIDVEVSSCSEIMYYLLSQYKINVSDPSYYTYLLAGIYLDTNKLNKNKYSSTLDAVSGLINKGADQSKVDDYFTLDFESDRRVHNLVDKVIPYNLTMMISVCDDGVYTKEEIAKAADYILKYKCDASIVAAKLQNGSYGVSARSKGRVGIDNIMYILNGGGGNLVNASCPALYTDENAEELKEKIAEIVFHKRIKD